MKYTNLEIVQAVLSSMDSDEINSVNDTVESQQVLEIVKTVYDDMVSRGDIVTNRTLFNLDASEDTAKPVLMTKPENIDRVLWLKYDVRTADDTVPVWADLTYLPVEDFIDYIHSFNPDEDNIEYFDYVGDGFIYRFTYRNDTRPLYYTSFDDNTIIFDAYDVDVDTTLQASKTLGYGTKTTEFAKTDEFTCELQPQQFALLLNEVKSLAWSELKQTEHGKAEQTARRNWRHLQKTRQQSPDGSVFNSNAHSFDKLPNFGRK